MSKPGPKPNRDIDLRIMTEKFKSCLVMFDPFKTKVKEGRPSSKGLYSSLTLDCYKLVLFSYGLYKEVHSRASSIL